MRHLGGFVFLILAVAAGQGQGAVAQEQAEASKVAVLRGTVVSEGSLSPLENAEVRLLGRPGRFLTDRSGRFGMAAVGPGTVVVQVEYLGYASVEDTLTLRAGVSYELDVRMSVSPIAVEPIEVTVRPEYVGRRNEAVYRRISQALFGFHFTKHDFERRGHPVLAEMLRRVPNARVVARRDFTWSVSFRLGCSPAVYLDGVRVDQSILSLSTWDVEVLEVYNSPAGMPVQFRDLGTHCAVLIWTKG
jgi:hypothetical protein